MTSEIENNAHTQLIHEASHAVIGRVLTLTCGQATIVPDYDEGSAGHSITEDHWRCTSEWQKRGKVRDNFDVVWHALIMMAMAGAEGEIELLGSTQGGDGNDQYQIELIAEELVGDRSWNRVASRACAR